MNLILLHREDFIVPPHTVRLQGRRFQYIQSVHQPALGDALCVGLKNGSIGTGTLLRMDKTSIELSVRFDRDPPPQTPVTLFLAMPRPKVFKRLIQAVTSMGVKRIYLFNTLRVEKSYWDSPVLQGDMLTKQIILGLEQAKDTIFPEIIVKKRFKPFIEDEVPTIIKGTLPLLAHPGSATPWPLAIKPPVTLVIGPEGGFIPYEVDKFLACGFTAVSLGPRILRVETAVPVLLGRLI